MLEKYLLLILLQVKEEMKSKLGERVRMRMGFLLFLVLQALF